MEKEKERIAREIARNLIMFFAGYYASQSATKVRPPPEETVARLIVPEMQFEPVRFVANGNIVYRASKDATRCRLVYTAPTAEQAQEIADALNTYGE